MLKGVVAKKSSSEGPKDGVSLQAILNLIRTEASEASEA